jgi:Protein of unknown function (DUF2937)
MQLFSQTGTLAMTTGYRIVLRDLTLLLCVSISILVFIQIPGFVTAYATGADQVARTALAELQKRYPAAKKDLSGFIVKTRKDTSAANVPLRQLIVTAEDLHRQAATLRAASWWEAPILLVREHEPRLLRGTLASYRPVMILQPGWAVPGMLWGWLNFAALGWLGKKLFRPRRASMARRAVVQA